MFIGGEPRIFVSIAAYRDTETPKTVRSLLEAADRPHRIKIGVLNQMSLREDQACLVGASDSVRETLVDYTEGLGACWARNYIWEKLYQGEEFVLQIDSHSRFDKGWDTKLLMMFESLNDPLAVLSHYPMPYHVLTETRDAQMYTRFDVQNFNHWGLPIISSAALSLAEAPAKPRRTAFIAGGCFFTRGKTIQAVPYDPYLYFQGEEVNYAVRLYTHGYNLYLPNKPFMYHDYGSNRGRKLHWQDNNTWGRYNDLSLMRNRHLLNIEPAKDLQALVNLTRYSLGTKRSLSEWESLAGLNLRNKHVTDKARTGAF